MATEDKTLAHPRILCLHGGGANGKIMRMQARTFIPYLSGHFRLVFADGPFECDPHPGLIPVYQDFGPFRFWTRWQKDQVHAGGIYNDTDAEGQAVVEECEKQMKLAMAEDDKLGATGEWVGLIGFSQGAKMSGSLLFESQLRMEARISGEDVAKETLVAPFEEQMTGDEFWNGPYDIPHGFAGGQWRFAVLFNGRGPFIALSDMGLAHAVSSNGVVEKPVTIFEEKDFWTLRAEPPAAAKRLSLPTIHVHGTKDPQIIYHQQTLKCDCHAPSTTLLQWDGDHRLPFKVSDVLPIVDAIYKVAKSVRVLPSSAKRITWEK